jgi:hypothetical protein
MATIAIVTSIQFGGHPRSCFEAGLSASGAAHPITIAPPYEAQGNYGVLNTLVSNAASTHPDLIVTAGGLAAATAASSMLNQGNGDPQFVYLSGVLLTGSNPCNSGGVNQNVPLENTERRNKLTGHPPPFNVNPARIWLVVNNNNPISTQEGTSWGTNVHPFFASGPNPPTNANDATASNHFIQEFAALAAEANPPLGLVISPDPYFRLWRTAFTIALANRLPVPVCYSYHDFVDAASTTANAANSVRLSRSER